MNGGRIEQVSPPTRLYSEPETEFVATFVGSLNQLHGTFADGRLTPGDRVTGIRPEHVSIHDHPTEGSFPATVSRVIPHGSFTEVVLDTGSESLRSYRSGHVP